MAWTTVSKDHLDSKFHAGKPHSEGDCKNINFLTEKDFETNLTHHIVRQEGKKSSKNVKGRASVINQTAKKEHAKEKSSKKPPRVDGNPPHHNWEDGSA